MHDLQHFGITVTDPRGARGFYGRVLRLPYISSSVNRGRKFDRMYGLEGAVNRLQWYQLSDEGIELFHLPTHPPRRKRALRLHEPGYTYVTLRAAGFEGYVERFERNGVRFKLYEPDGARRLLVRDPDGVNVIVSELPGGGSVEQVDSLGEAGLTVTDFEGYDEFFDVLGLPQEVEGDAPGHVSALFELREPVRTRRYGCVRLLRFPRRRAGKIERRFPYSGAPPRGYFPDPGIKHAAWYVDDIGEFHRRAKRAGIRFLFPPCTILGGAKMTYFLDPEGNTMEVMEVPVLARLAIDVVGLLRRKQMELAYRTGKLMFSGR
ncbi:MAG: VOC family protein [bacterium]